jgi:hypothetical protein
MLSIITTGEYMSTNLSLSQAIKNHVAKSSNDRNVEQAITTLSSMLFNLLNCQPFSAKTLFKDGYMVNFKDKNKYSQSELDTISQMVSSYLQTLKSKKPFEDILSDELASHLDGSWGQYLTPSDLSLSLSKLNITQSLSKIEEAYKSNQMFRIGDICGCGAGSLLLSTLHTIYLQAPHLLSCISVTGVDKDETMCKLTASQLAYNCIIHNIPLFNVEVHHCNAVTEYGVQGKDTCIFVYDTKIQKDDSHFQNLFSLLDKLNNHVYKTAA